MLSNRLLDSLAPAATAGAAAAGKAVIDASQAAVRAETVTKATI